MIQGQEIVRESNKRKGLVGFKDRTYQRDYGMKGQMSKGNSGIVG
jgi:hypothetical protein